MIWKNKIFDELSLDEFHDILQLRIDVFVVEQDCPYPELDGKDRIARHLFAVDPTTNKIVAYSRFFKPGDYHSEAAFGRVVVHPDFRRKKLGHRLVEHTVSEIKRLFKVSVISISAQTYLTGFYRQHGFKTTGREYLEDGIPHIKMIYSGD